MVSQMNEGCAPLSKACEKGSVEIVEYLITHCAADVQKCGSYNICQFATPLWIASSTGNLPVVKCLVRHGANIDR